MYARFEQLLQKHGITSYKVSKDTGITQTSLSNWKSGRSTPNVKTLQKLADYFGVSIEYLMGTEVENPENNKKIPQVEELDGVYLSWARKAQADGIKPEDIELAIKTIKAIKESRGE